MVGLIIISLLALNGVSAAAPVCSIYQCTTFPNSTALSSQCISYNSTSNTYGVQTCASSSQYCPPLVGSALVNSTNCTNYPTTPYVGGFAYPGEYCNNSTDCFNGYNCTKNVCIGVSSGGYCSSNYNCAPGLYCNSSNYCVAQLSTGKYCANDYQCENTAFCSTQKNNTCQSYYSVSPGYVVTDCIGYETLQSETGACGAIGSQSYAFKRVESLLKIPIVVNSTQNNCGSTSTTINGTSYSFAGDYACGYNQFGAAYCYLFPGDSIYNKKLNYQEDWFDSKYIKKCNTARRAAAYCQYSVWDSDDYIYWQYYTEYVAAYPTLQNSTSCVTTVYNSEYETLYAEYDDVDSAIWLTSSLVLAALALN